ncbi:serine protease [Streptomyces sp. TRM68416]|uniref:serine protease n=1 Tax=Streptomyces sp. TRM68416 TaxID=2758412 RepID=UPI001661AABB|nr:serine protease [Streptomyces sp. TRM68416]MBD0842449.1 serine protease [Streptomyces sp. TRM68416]
MATAEPDDELARGIARFWSEDGRVTGTGFLIADRTLCTCAHVVADALGTPDTARTPPAYAVTVDFPLLTSPSPRLRATVTHWRPVADDGGGDMALLALEDPAPGTTAVRFAGGTAVWDHPFRVLGFPLRTDDHGVWVDGRLRAPVGKGWTSMEPRPSPRGPVIGQGFSGAPVWDTEQGGVVGMTVAADTGTGATTAYLIPAALLLGLDPALCPSPFRGLESFREQDASIFFARRADSERIAAALLEHPFVPVAGASGVGKSSLVRAGVLPLLRSLGHTVTDFAGQPDTDPVRTLAEALAAQFPSAAEPARRLGGDRETAVLLGARILEQCGTAGHVVLLDQFEETVGARPADARALLDVLLPMARATHPAGRRLRVLATLRSASLEELVTGGRAEALSGTVQMVAPMTPAQLDEVVRCPVAAVPGVDFEPGLPELLVAEAGAEPGALPLLEFTLAELWDRRRHGRLTHAAYREIGGVEGALSRYADHQLAQVCKAPDGPDEPTARRLFEQLARPVRGKEYARVARAFDQLPPELRAAAQALAATRLLVISRDSSGRETVALAHEALVRQWPTLRNWLDESRALLVRHEKLRARLREWEDGGRHDDLLLRGKELTTTTGSAALRPAELSAPEKEFIRLSRHHHRRSVRRSRTGVALVAVLALIAVTLTYFVTQAGQDADRKEREGAANELATRSLDRFSDDPVEGAALAVLAHRTEPTKQTYKALLHAYPGMAMVRSIEEGFFSGRVTALAASADGKRVVALEEDHQGDLRGYVITGLATGKPRKNRLESVPDGSDAVAVSDDGARVAAAGPEGQGKVWSAVGRRTVAEWPGGRDPGGTRSEVLDFSADGKLLLHMTAKGTDDGCIDGTPKDQLRLHFHDAEKGQAIDVPPGLLGTNGCLTGAALPSGQGKSARLIVLAEGRKADAREPLTVRAHALDSGVQRWKESALDAMTLGVGGRTLWTSGDQEFKGDYRNPATGERRESAPAYRQPAPSDATGRYSRTYSGSGDLWQDSRTGAEYAVLRPLAYTHERGACPDSPLDVMTRHGEDTPVLHVLCGRDLVSFRTRPVQHAPREEWDHLAVFAPSGRQWAVLGSSRASARDTDRITLSVLGGQRLRGRQVGSERPWSFGEPSGAVFSRDESRLAVWSDLGWALYKVRPTGLDVVRIHPDERRSPEENPLARDIRPLGNEDFLMLGAKGVQRLDRDGLLTSAHAPDCREPRVRNPLRCLAVEVSPRDGTAWVLRRNGKITRWNPQDGSGRRTTRQLGLPPDHFDRRGMRFRDDGGHLAVLLRDAMVLIDPVTARGTRRVAVEKHGVIGAYGSDGRMVLVPPADYSAEQVELWSEKRKEALGPLDAFWLYGAWRIVGDVLYHGNESGVWKIPLDSSVLAGTLCTVLGDHNPLARRADLPAAAHKGALCPKPSKASEQSARDSGRDQTTIR